MFLEIKNLTSGYGGNEVLKNLSISIDRGDIVALIGPNGAGKSTVLKSIAGLANIKSGEIFWQDNLISRLSTHLLFEENMLLKEEVFQQVLQNVMIED